MTYDSIHAFRWIAPDGSECFVRYRFEPEAGERSIRDEEAKERGWDYLQEEIAERESAAFRLFVVVAEAGDPVDDPTVAWPEEREHVEVGRLVLDGPGPGARARRRHPRVRPHPADRRHRTERGPDPHLPAARLLGGRWARRAGV